MKFKLKKFYKLIHQKQVIKIIIVRKGLELVMIALLLY